MIEKINKFIKDNNLFETNKVILGFSYGIDSSCLLDILLKLNYEVVLAFVNHNLRAESKLEEAEALKLAKEKNLKIYIKQLNLDNKNVESSARKLRYEFFKEVAIKENTNQIVTAHHMQDNLESIILNILRGSNLYGYAGISPKYNKNGFNFIRPLLCVTKDEIKEYQKENNIKYFEDYTNSLDLYKRNRIRHNIVPELIKEDSNALYKFLEYSKIVRDSFNHIRYESISYLKSNDNKINVNSFKLLDNVLKSDIICYMLEEKDITKNNEKINEIIKMILNNKPNSKVDLNNNLEFIKSYDFAFINEKNTIFPQSKLIDLENDCIFNNYHIYFSKNLPLGCTNYTKLCYNKLVLPLTVRGRNKGDTIKTNYGHKKLKDIFIDKKIPKNCRDNAVIITDSEEILWVVGVIRSDSLFKYKDDGDIYLICEDI